MATYTDLHKNIKESVVVDYSTRVSPQRVEFLNPDNVFYGKFKGTIDSTGFTIEGGDIKNVNIENASLKNVTLDGATIAIDQYGKEIELHAADIEELKHVDEQLYSHINTEVENRIAQFNLLSGYDSALELSIQTSLESATHAAEDKISEISGFIMSDMSNISAELNTKLTDEISRSKIADFLISEKVSQLDTAINVEAKDRIDADNLLLTNINEVEEKSVARHTDVIEKLTEHSLLNDKDFANLHSEMLSTVLHDKHYTLHGHADELLETYPYELKDFCVNVIKTNHTEAFVQLEDSIIGSLSYTNDEVTFTTNNLNSALALKSSLLPNWNYTFSKTTPTTIKTDINEYNITYTPAKETFVISHPTGTYYAVKGVVNGRLEPIGTITNYELTSDGKSFKSGVLTINTNIADYSVFNICYERQFDNSNNKFIELPTIGGLIEYIPETMSFTFKAGKTEINYAKLLDVRGAEYGQIVEGHVLKENDLLIKFDVELFDIEKVVTLSQENNFRYDATTYMVSAMINGDFAKIDVFRKNAYYDHRCYLENDETFSGRSFASVVPQDVNTTITSGESRKVKVYIDEGTLADKFKGPFVLEDDINTELKIWKCSKAFDDGSRISLEFDGEFLRYNAYNADTGVTPSARYRVKLTDPTIFNNDDAFSAIRIGTSSSVLDYLEHDIVYASNYIGKIDTTPIVVTIPNVKLIASANEHNIIKFKVPTKKYSDIARELMLAMFFRLVDEDGNEVSLTIKLEFVDLNNAPVEIFNLEHKSISIKTNKWNTIQLLEISDNGIDKFLITDYDHYEIRDNITYLNTYADNLANEIDDLSNATSYISAEVKLNDGDIEYLSSEIKLNDNDISDLNESTNYLSGEVSTIQKHYSDTFIIDDELKFENKTESNEKFNTIKVDHLILVDEITADSYKLSIKNGALTVIKVKDASLILPTVTE